MDHDNGNKRFLKKLVSKQCLIPTVDGKGIAGAFDKVLYRYQREQENYDIIYEELDFVRGYVVTETKIGNMIRDAWKGAEHLALQTFCVSSSLFRADVHDAILSRMYIGRDFQVLSRYIVAIPVWHMTLIPESVDIVKHNNGEKLDLYTRDMAHLKKMRIGEEDTIKMTHSKQSDVVWN